MKQLNPQEMDALTGMMIVLFHAAERCSNILMQQYAEQYKASQSYKEIAKKAGKIQADLLVKEQTERILTQRDKLQVKRILKQAEELQRSISRMTDVAISIGEQDQAFDNFDALLCDANNVCKLVAYYSNLRTEDDYVKADSTLKVLAKGNKVSAEIIKHFDMQ